MYLRPAPLDEVTGMPPFVLTHYSASPSDVNYHHTWFPKRHHELLADYPYVNEIQAETYSLHELGGMAVRMSRGQLMPIDVHVEFHRQYAGPQLPLAAEDKFITAVRGCAGVLPRWGLDLTRPGRHQRVPLDVESADFARMLRNVKPEHHHYWHHKEARRAILGEYFVRYALQQDFAGVPGAVVDEFLHTADTQRRQSLGNMLLMGALDASVQPLQQSYAYQKRHRMVRPGAPEPLAAVKKQLAPHALPKYHGYLEDRLLAA